MDICNCTLHIQLDINLLLLNIAHFNTAHSNMVNLLIMYKV